MAKVTWTTPAGSLGTITERRYTEIPLDASSDTGEVTFSLHAGELPRGMKLEGNIIAGMPVEVSIYTESRFVIRADDGSDLEDRTFSIGVDGADYPIWITNEGYLNVGPGDAYFVLDNAQVDFQLEAYDDDESAGDVLEYRLLPRGGELPPGLSLSIDGRITGFTDPIFAFDTSVDSKGGYDVNPFDITPSDFASSPDSGFDSFLYDNTIYDFNYEAELPRRLSRSYTFVVEVSDGLNLTTRAFKIYVVTEEFLKADNTLVEVDTNVFTADSSAARSPIWITESDLGGTRANNYVTIFLDVYKPDTLPGTISYMLPTTNPGRYELLGSDQVVPGNWEISGKLPVFTYNMRGEWRSDLEYRPGDAVLYADDTDPLVTNKAWVCIKQHIGQTPVPSEYWTKENIIPSRQEYTLPDTLLWEPVQVETVSTFPPGLEFDSVNGQLAGRVPYQSAVTETFTFTVDAVYYPGIEYTSEYNFRGNWSATVDYAADDTVRYNDAIYVAVTENTNVSPIELDTWIPSVSTTSKTFFIDIFGEIDSAIQWVTEPDLGTIKPNIPSQLAVVAESLLYGNTVHYELVDGELPRGLTLLPNGIIKGRVKQFANENRPGLTRLYTNTLTMVQPDDAQPFETGDYFVDVNSGATGEILNIDGETHFFDFKSLEAELDPDDDISGFIIFDNVIAEITFNTGAALNIEYRDNSDEFVIDDYFIGTTSGAIGVLRDIVEIDGIDDYQFDYYALGPVFLPGEEIVRVGFDNEKVGTLTNFAKDFNITFDDDTTSFDKEFTFTVQAWDSLQFAKAERTFYFTVIADQDTTFVNLHVKALPPKENRLLWNGFITDVSIFDPALLYRNGDPNFAAQTNLQMLVFAGIEKKDAAEYVSAMSRNHYRKRILFGDVKSAVAKDPETQEPIYEVVYVEAVDDYEKDGTSISSEIELRNNIESAQLVNTSHVTADSDVPKADEQDHQTMYPNSITNMRSRIKPIGERDRDYLPLWMRSIQPDSRVETGFVKAIVLCYAKPGEADTLIAKIKATGFDFKDLDFETDRYLIDVRSNGVKDKYFAFPHPREKEL